MTVKQNNVVRDYDGRPLEENEALALFPYNKLDAAQVTNPDCIRTARVAGRRFKCILKAVPKEYVALANSQYSDWENEVLPPRRDGRCLIPQGDGTFKECPRKKGDNHCSCAACPHKGEYEKKVKTFLSLDEAMDRYELEFSSGATPETEHIERENENTAKLEFTRFVEDIIQKSPKHAYALLLMCLGYKGDRLAERMRLTRTGANYVKKQLEELAPNGISGFDKINLKDFKASRCMDEEYYRGEAERALPEVLDRYF